MDDLAERHQQAYHTTVIRDYRPHHALFEKLLTPQVVYSLLLVNMQTMQTRCTTRAATMDLQLTRALHYPTAAAQQSRRMRPRLPPDSAICPLPVRDLLCFEELQQWTCVQSSQGVQEKYWPCSLENISKQLRIRGDKNIAVRGILMHACNLPHFACFLAYKLKTFDGRICFALT